MAYRKVLRSQDKPPLQEQRSPVQSQNVGDYFSRRVATELVENDDEFEIQKAMRKYGFNFKRGTVAFQQEKSPQKKPNRKHCSGSKEKRPINLFSTSKAHNRKIITSAKHLHAGLQHYEDLLKKKASNTRHLVTEVSPKPVRSKQKLSKKNKDSRHKLPKQKKLQPNTNTLEKSKKWRERSSVNCQVGIDKASKTQTTQTDKDSTCPEIQILEKVGQGTFGTVYKARMGNRMVAVKKVFQDKKYKNRELQILQLLQGEFVLKVMFTFYTKEVEEGEQKEYLNVVMEYYEYNLVQFLHQQRKQPTDLEIKLLMYQLFRGLAYIHSLDICHRDIKPPNLLVHKQNRQLVICDFGSAKILIKGQPNIAYICSRCYRAPELIFGCTNYTTMVDIWSAGCVMLEMLKGQPFFIGESNLDQLVQIIKVMGTPSKTDVVNMNPDYNLDDYKFPKVKKRQWRSIFPKLDDDTLSFLQQIMIYSPKQRLNACQALAHEYFDDLRNQTVYKQMISRWNLPVLFEFSKEEVRGNQHLLPKLVPSWFKRKPIKF